MVWLPTVSPLKTTGLAATTENAPPSILISRSLKGVPFIVADIEPFEIREHEAAVCVRIRLSSSGCVMLTVDCDTQLFVSCKVTTYIPAPSPLRSSDVGANIDPSLVHE